MRLKAVVVLALSAKFCVAGADPIFRFQEPSGRTVYSSRGDPASEVPHKLPLISKQPSLKVKAVVPTCRAHGGINCTKGPDSDGSVICYDGFKDALNRFSIDCTAAKLSLIKVEQPGPSGNLEVVIRNSKGVPASRPAVLYMLDRFHKVPLSGPEQIPAYGSAAYSAYIPKDVLPPDGSPVSSKHLWITCENCG